MTSSAIPSHLACPACQRVTPLPSQAAPNAVLRCPHCRSPFALQDLLGDPGVTWELVSDASPDRWGSAPGQMHAKSADQESAASDDLEDVELLGEGYTQAVAAAQLARVISPGAETVEMSDSEALVESWKGAPPVELPPVEDVAESSAENAAQNTVENPADDARYDDLAQPPVEASPARKLEGPLVGEFYDDPEPEFEYSAGSSWRSANQPAVADRTAYVGAQGVGELGESAGFQSFSTSPPARRSRPRRSPLWSMLQVSLGGLAAIPVSLLLMWHLLGTDIGDAAPWVAQYAPAIVPQKFHAHAPPAGSGQPSRIADPAASLPRLPLPSPAVPRSGMTAEDSAAAHSADEIPTVQPRAMSDIELPADSLEPTTEPLVTEFQADDAVSAADTLFTPGRSIDVDVAQSGQSGQSGQFGQSGQSPAGELTTSTETSHDVVDSYDLDAQSLTALLDGLQSPDMAVSVDDSTAGSLDTSAENNALADMPFADDSSPQAADDLHAAALENCFALIQETDSMLEDWSVAVGAKQHDLPLAQKTYGQLAGLALAIDKLPSRELVQQAMRGQLKSVGQQVEHKLEVRNLIDQGARFWIRSQSQPAAEADQESTAEVASTASGEDRYGLAVTAVVDRVTPSDDGQWSLVTASATTPASGSEQPSHAAKLPLELKIPQHLIDLLPQSKLSAGQRLFLLGTVRLPAQAGTVDSDAAAIQPPVVANYLAPL